MNLPPKYWLMNYDEETGEVLSFHNPMRGKPDVSPLLTVSVENHAEIQTDPSRWRVVDGKLTLVNNVPEDQIERQTVDVASAIIGGLVVDGICYALEPIALSPMMMDLAAGSSKVRAIIHSPSGTKLEAMTRDDALKVAEAISEHLVGLHLG